eukprot:scaffold9964_cov31-Phaeocystis_antarctica.AAC.1
MALLSSPTSSPSSRRWSEAPVPVWEEGQDGRQGSRPGGHPLPHYQKDLSRRDSAFVKTLASLGLQKTGSKYSNLLKGPRPGPKPHAAASLRPPGSHLVRVAGWHLELLSGRPGRDEDLTASGRPPMSGDDGHSHNFATAFLRNLRCSAHTLATIGHAAKWRVVVKVEPPKGPEGLTRHYEVSSSQYMAAETGGWRRAASCSVKHLARKMWASVRMTPSLK